MRRFREMDSNSRQHRDRQKNIKPVQMIRKWLDIKFLHSLVIKDPTKWSGGSSPLSSKEIKLNSRVTNDWVANSNHKISPCLCFLNLPFSWLINHPTWAQTAISKMHAYIWQFIIYDDKESTFLINWTMRTNPVKTLRNPCDLDGKKAWTAMHIPANNCTNQVTRKCKLKKTSFTF